MEQPHAERRLAAILAADVAGYSRLMGANEDGTLVQLKAHRRALVDPKIKEHRGHIVKTTGDGMLMELASVVDAVRCAVEIQRGMAERNAGVPHNRRSACSCSTSTFGREKRRGGSLDVVTGDGDRSISENPS